MKKDNYYIYLSEQERNEIIRSLINLKNNLTVQGKYTDAVDDVIIKISNARKKRVVVRYRRNGTMQSFPKSKIFP